MTVNKAPVDWSRTRGVDKAIKLLRSHGVITTGGIVASVIEDLYLRTFDRLYGVRTSGYIPLNETSLPGNLADKGHRYRPVNAWAFGHTLRRLALSKELRFVDLGCGLGRACLIAADYGFCRVRGVDVVPEFCAVAKSNIESFRRRRSDWPPVEIVLQDAVDYCKDTDDDVIFLYNPFPPDVLRNVVANLVKGANSKSGTRLIIYTERVIETSRTLEVLEQNTLLMPLLSHSSWGQAFHIFAQHGG